MKHNSLIDTGHVSDDSSIGNEILSDRLERKINTS